MKMAFDVKRSFAVHDKHSWETVEWLYSKEHSTDSKIQLLAYDANLCGLPQFQDWPETKHKQHQIDTILKYTEGFEGEVWLDDVRIK